MPNCWRTRSAKDEMPWQYAPQSFELYGRRLNTKLDPGTTGRQSTPTLTAAQMNLLVPTNIPVLSERECDLVRETLMALRGHWMSRHAELPLFTLGVASYIDAVGDTPAYARLAREFNPLFKQHFDWLYDRVAAVLAQSLGEPVGYAHHLSLPGFHIFLSAKEFEHPIAIVHFDAQYLQHDWQGQLVDLDHLISFTLAIRLPRHGGGLNVWDISYAEWLACAGETPGELARGHTPAYHAYQRGHMALHSGHLMHQIAPGIDLQPDDERITLQGHGVRVAGVWQLYW